MWTIDFETVSVAFTGREGGVSEAPYDSLNIGCFTGDATSSVEQNLEIVRASLGLERLHWCRQVHGSQLHDADGDEVPGSAEADGLFTRKPRVGVCVAVADCLPVALAGRECAMILHCGWRGLAAGLVAAGIRALGDDKPCAAIGPGIGVEHYEVGEEVIEALGQTGRQAYEGGHLDLRAVACAQLRAAGVETIESVDLCTYQEQDRLFSYRRDGETGRQAGIAWLR